MISVSATLDAAAVSRFNAALDGFQSTLRKDAQTAPRQAAIIICKAIRAKSRTKTAKKNRGMKVSVSSERPQWITYRNGQKLPRPLRRWSVTLTDRGKTFTRFVYAADKSGMRRQLRQLVGTNYYPTDAKESGPKRKGGTRGLARRSWGWVMHNIYHGAAPDTPWQKRKGDKRNPKDAASGSMSKDFLAIISNRLSYAMDALKNGMATLNDAIESATHTLEKRIKTRNFGRG